MAYTKAQRKEICRVLREAKQYLAANYKEVRDTDRGKPGCFKEEYICYAVATAAGPWADNSIYMITNMIESRLSPYVTFDDWLSGQPGTGVSLCQYRVRRPNEMTTRIQQHRHAWVDMLIEEFSK